MTSVEKLEKLENELWKLDREMMECMLKCKEYENEVFMIYKQLESTLFYTLPEKKNTDYYSEEQLEQNVIDMEKISKWYKYKHEKAKAYFFEKKED